MGRSNPVRYLSRDKPSSWLGAFCDSPMSVLPTKENPSPPLTARGLSLRFTARRLALFGAVTAAAAFLLFVPTSRPSLNNNLRNYDLKHSMPAQCADTSPIPVTAPRHNVWKNFDVEEAATIREWLWAYKDSDGRGFNFKSGVAATDL